MKLLSEANFRELSGKYLLVLCRDLLEEMFSEGIDDDFNGLFVYGYIDQQEGLSFRPFLLASAGETGVRVNDIPDSDNTMHIIRYRTEITTGKMNEYHNGDHKLVLYGIDPGTHVFIDLEHLGIDTSEFEAFGKHIDDAYSVDPVKESTRTEAYSWLDKYRNPMFPDDVLVTLYKDQLEPEQVWVRILAVTEDGLFFGDLLNEPWKNFGCHEHEIIVFKRYQKDDFETLIYTGQKAIFKDDSDD